MKIKQILERENGKVNFVIKISNTNIIDIKDIGINGAHILQIEIDKMITQILTINCRSKIHYEITNHKIYIKHGDKQLIYLYIEENILKIAEILISAVKQLVEYIYIHKEIE